MVLQNINYIKVKKIDYVLYTWMDHINLFIFLYFIDAIICMNNNMCDNMFIQLQTSKYIRFSKISFANL